MQKFIKQLLVFIFGLFIFFCANISINTYIFSHTNVGLDNKRILILGDSHPEGSLITGLFGSAQNISQTSEPYVVTYWKLRKILDTYKPDTLIVGFAPHNISLEFNS
jgi:hypothetical protein